MDSESEHEVFEDGDGDLAGDASEAGDDQEDEDIQLDEGGDDETEGGEGSEEDDDEEDADDDEGDDEGSEQDAGEDESEQYDATMDIDASQPSTDRGRLVSQREPAPIQRSLSPAHARRASLYTTTPTARSYTIEPIAAIPHPVATHCLASSLCFSHLLTGSQDGYIRNYDVFASCNGKTFLTAPQRHHCGLGDAPMRAGILRSWWESTTPVAGQEAIPPVYSMAVHSDALWGLSGNAEGKISLFTIRHDPGRVVHVIQGHQKAVSAMCLAPDEKGAYSASWDNLAIHWDLNTGQNSRTFSGHTAQLTAIAVRPFNVTPPTAGPSAQADSDARSEASFDDLFDEDENSGSRPGSKAGGGPGLLLPSSQRNALAIGRGIAQLEGPAYSEFSQDMLLTASIDGQIVLWDRRVRDRAGRLDMGDKCPPWCISASWSADGSQVYAGRRNGTIDVWDVRQLGLKGQNTPRVLKILRNPGSSGMVSCVTAFPDGRHVACASQDNIRLWNVQDADTRSRSLGFKIIAGHHGGVVSQILVDRGSRFMVTGSGDRGWFGESTKTVLVHEIKHLQ
ncbi:WD40 repeat-like protein [Exidia glandulosa HHB12029]|uniref:WD40 repeat-like protein n=1 Tax=Exidia glandulosa HHB12029 TaxID=1314781 RepID=A0A165EBW6_EXIGL|nr:WD40 repeat-like protein [Exidia glandulosa HHB12029]